MPETLVYEWTDCPVDAPMALITRRRILGEKAMLSHIVLEAGCDVPVHAHENEQFAIVLSGKARFTLGEGDAQRVVDVEGSPEGTVLHMPANEPHGCLALERTVILDVFAPPSEKTGVDSD